MLKELAAKAKAIDIKELALQVAKQNGGLILERQREQLSVGENANGSDIGKYTTKRYSDLKRRMGTKAPYGTPDLKLSGKLHSELFVKIRKTTFNINSDVEYSKYQIQRYGKNIYGLQKENAKDVQFENSRDIAKRYKELLGL